MTTLSKWLVIADISSNFATAIMAIGIIIVMCGAFVSFCLSLLGDAEHDDASHFLGAKWRAYVLRPSIVALVAVILVQLVPSKKTMYMVIGVESLQIAATDPESAKLLRLLRAKIEGYLQPEGN